MKDAKALYQQMKEEFCQETGFAMEDGADLAVRLYACAAQLESLYRYADWCVEQAFPQTAQGEQLALHGALRGLDRAPAPRAFCASSCRRRGSLL